MGHSREGLKRLGLLVLMLGGLNMPTVAAEPWDGKIVQYGRMHEAIGKRQHQGRVKIQELVQKPHFFGVAALESLAGEATIRDGEITISRVGPQGGLTPGEKRPQDVQATLLVGAYVSEWTEHTVVSPVDAKYFDQFLAGSAAKAGLPASKPFVFTVEGEFSNLRWHVINGACPLHARLRKLELPKDQQPFESTADNTRGTLVGIYAEDAVGNLTHPDTSCHVHVIFADAASGKRVTGHVEQVGLMAGAVLHLPK